jgi:hypothetical protein
MEEDNNGPPRVAELCEGSNASSSSVTGLSDWIMEGIEFETLGSFSDEIDLPSLTSNSPLLQAHCSPGDPPSMTDFMHNPGYSQIFSNSLGRSLLFLFPCCTSIWTRAMLILADEDTGLDSILAQADLAPVLPPYTGPGRRRSTSLRSSNRSLVGKLSPAISNPNPCSPATSPYPPDSQRPAASGDLPVLARGGPHSGTARAGECL